MNSLRPKDPWDIYGAGSAAKQGSYTPRAQPQIDPFHPDALLAESAFVTPPSVLNDPIKKKRLDSFYQWSRAQKTAPHSFEKWLYEEYKRTGRPVPPAVRAQFDAFKQTPYANDFADLPQYAAQAALDLKAKYPLAMDRSKWTPEQQVGFYLPLLQGRGLNGYTQDAQRQTAELMLQELQSAGNQYPTLSAMSQESSRLYPLAKTVYDYYVSQPGRYAPLDERTLQLLQSYGFDTSKIKWWEAPPPLAPSPSLGDTMAEGYVSPANRMQPTEPIKKPEWMTPDTEVDIARRKLQDELIEKVGPVAPSQPYVDPMIAKRTAQRAAVQAQYDRSRMTSASPGTFSAPGVSPADVMGIRRQVLESNGLATTEPVATGLNPPPRPKTPAKFAPKSAYRMQSPADFSRLTTGMSSAQSADPSMSPASTAMSNFSTSLRKYPEIGGYTGPAVKPVDHASPGKSVVKAMSVAAKAKAAGHPDPVKAGMDVIMPGWGGTLSVAKGKFAPTEFQNSPFYKGTAGLVERVARKARRVGKYLDSAYTRGVREARRR